MRRRLISIILTLALCISFIPVSTVTVHAASIYNYSSAKALAYAKENVNIDPYDVDCIHYVNNCVVAGGGPAKATGIKKYVEYMTTNNYAVLNKLTTKTTSFNSKNYYVYEGDNKGLVAPGDMFIFHCNACGRNWHCALVAPPDKSGTYKGYYRYYAHNGPVNNKLMLRYEHNRTYCQTPKSNTAVYCLHFKSKENGYDKNGNYVGTSATTTTTAPTTTAPTATEPADPNAPTDPNATTTTTTKATTSTSSFKSFTVKTKSNVLMKKGPSKDYKKVGTLSKGKTRTIVDKKKGWGKLTNGYWINLYYTEVTDGYVVTAARSDNVYLRVKPNKNSKTKGYLKKGNWKVSKICGSYLYIKSKGYWVYSGAVTRKQ